MKLCKSHLANSNFQYSGMLSGTISRFEHWKWSHLGLKTLTACVILPLISLSNWRIQSKSIARVMCGVTTSLRFPGQLNGWVIVTGSIIWWLLIMYPAVTSVNLGWTWSLSLGWAARHPLEWNALTGFSVAFPNAKLRAVLWSKGFFFWEGLCPRADQGVSFCLIGPVSIADCVIQLVWSQELACSLRSSIRVRVDALQWTSIIQHMNRRYLTAATIFRGKISSREVSFPYFDC